MQNNIVTVVMDFIFCILYKANMLKLKINPYL